MDFTLTETQQSIVDSAAKLLTKHAGPKRARQVLATSGYDPELASALREAGFLSLMKETGALEAAMVTEAISARAGLVHFGAAAMVAPALGMEIDEPVALSRQRGPVRYGASAKTLLILDGADVRVRRVDSGEARPMRSNFGFPFAELPADGGERLSGAGAKMRAWWRVVLAVEIAGALRGCLTFTTDYVKERRQFGRAIGSFQAIQHRLADCVVLTEASRWLAYEAAFQGAPDDGAEVAISYAAAAARRVFHEVHQMNGAIGFTREHDLHVWSMRLQALALEMGGA